MDVPHFIYPSANGHLSSFYFLAIINNAAMKIHIQDFVLAYVFISLEYISRSGTRVIG